MQYPKDFHNDYFSIGLNHIAFEFNTKYAFTGHKAVYEYYLENKISKDKIILINPLAEEESIIDTFDYIEYDINDRNVFTYNYVYRDNKHFRHFLEAAINNESIPYPNYFSVLASAIYYLIKNKYNNIVLAGCNGDRERVGNWEHLDENPNEKMIKYRIFHQTKLIQIAKEYNINIIQCNNYNEYLTNKAKWEL